MKAKTSQKRIHTLNKLIVASALLFVVVSFIGFYMSITEIELLYINLIKGILILDLLFMIVGNQLIKDEKNKYKYSHEYTFMVSRK